MRFSGKQVIVKEKNKAEKTAGTQRQKQDQPA